MSSDLYIDSFTSSDRSYDDKDSETIWIGHLGTCTYYGYHLTDKIHEYKCRNCLMFSPVEFLVDDQTGVISSYSDQPFYCCFNETSENDHSSCNQPMTVEDVEALVKIFDELYKHWQHLNSLTDEEFDALGHGYMRPTLEKVKEDIFSGEEIRDSLSEMIGFYWNTRCD